MSDLKNSIKDHIDAAANAGKNATNKVADKLKDVAHSAGNKMEEGGRKLKGV